MNTFRLKQTIRRYWYTYSAPAMFAAVFSGLILICFWLAVQGYCSTSALLQPLVDARM